jgi:hypothetical protein
VTINRARKGPQGRKADPKTSARNARNRLVEPVRAGTRYAQLIEAMQEDGLAFGDRLKAFCEDGDHNDPRFNLGRAASASLILGRAPDLKLRLLTAEEMATLQATRMSNDDLEGFLSAAL